MDPVTSLSNYGKGKNVLIIAGGTSVKKFRFNMIQDLETFDFFGVNFQFPEKTRYGRKIKFDYQIYTDKAFADLSEKMDFGDTKLIGLKTMRPNDINHISKKASYYFDESMLDLEKDSCFYAVKICADIMNYDNIYIIGLDAYSKGVIHYWGDSFILDGVEYTIHCNERKLIHNVQFQRMQTYYAELQGYNNIYNCNPKSKIKYLRYGIPW